MWRHLLHFPLPKKSGFATRATRERRRGVVGSLGKVSPPDFLQGPTNVNFPYSSLVVKSPLSSFIDISLNLFNFPFV